MIQAIEYTRCQTWRGNKHDEKVELIIEAYTNGHNAPATIAAYVSSKLKDKVSKEQIKSVYRVHKGNGGKLNDYPMVYVPPAKPIVANMALAEKMWRDGYIGSEIAAKIGITRSQLYTFIEGNRSRFPPRGRVGRPTKLPSPTYSVTSYKDRVTRLVNGWPVTLRRVSFIDGRAGE